jgi:hypothetical protein
MTTTAAAAAAATVTAVDTYNTQQSTKDGSRRRDGGGGSNMRIMAATATADGTMTVLAATTTTAAAVAGGGDSCGRVFRRRRAVAEGSQKVAKANWRFHPPVRHRVFDAVLKHGWPSAPCHGANMAEKKLKPLQSSITVCPVVFAPARNLNIRFEKNQS